MESLRVASEARTAHEVADHDYHHVRLAEEKPYSPTARIKTPKAL